ncbi:MAG: tetraacyldisaccharide 4'-kinase [Deltaproteobacteria bacterium]|nr:tetraacyldisaccharide 4'-kinase [Deltaproteobacteria bacterium]
MSHKAQIQTDREQVRYGGISERIFRLILEEDRQLLSVTFLRALATLAAWLYNKTVALRNLLFDHGVLKIHKLNCPVISVGNLAVGGTGKTPMVAWLARLFSEEGYRVGIVSRGYGGIESRRVTIVSDGKNILADQAISGDEPLMLARQLSGIPVLCSTKRVRAAKAAIKKFDCNLLILDDGFQHRYLARDLDVVMLDSRDPYGGNRVLPRGTMREKAAALARAQVLVLSRFDGSEAAEKNCDNIRRQWPNKTIVTAIHRPMRIFSAADNRERPSSSLMGSRLAAFAGISQPDDFFQSVHNLGGRLVYTAPLPDHYPLTSDLLASLARKASRFEPEIWITTEKDWVRLPKVIPQGMKLWVMAIEIDFQRDETQLMESVLKVIEAVKLGSEDSQR